MNTSFRSTTCALCALAGLVVVSAKTAEAAPGGNPAAPQVTRTHRAPDRAQPFMISGVLSAPSTAQPEQTARAFLATRPAVLGNADPATLTVERTVPLRGGHLVRFQQRHNGMPVIGGEARVRLDGQGRVRWVFATVQEIPASVDEPAAISPAQALDAVARAAGYGDRAIAAFDVRRTVRPAIYAVAIEVPRRAYWVELPRDLRHRQTIRAYVDAQSGQLFQLDNMFRHADGGSGDELPVCVDGSHMAYVFDVNPTSSELSCVSLSDFLAPDATALANADIAIGNCIDNDRCEGRSMPGGGETIYIHVCDLDPTASTNADGDFTDYVFPGNTHPSDAFAEVQAFYHLNKVYAVARALGDFTSINTQPIWAYVNYKEASFNSEDTGCDGEIYVGDASLAFYDNAFFASGGMFGDEGDYIAFGQGVERDYAYDGDVAYHEFGHAVMYTISPELSSAFYDVFGYNTTPGGLHEGYADLMTMFTTNDHVMAEYAGADASNGIRNMENDKVCPDDLVGESHYDAEPFTGAIWEARTLVADTEARRTAFDEALYAAQHALGAVDDFRTTAAKILGEIEIGFDVETADQVEEVLTRRGINGCNNRIMPMSPSKVHTLMYVRGSRREGSGDRPAPIQYRYDLQEPATALRVRVAASAPSGYGSESLLRVALKRSGNPIHWTFPDGVGAGFFDESVELALAPAESGGNGTAVFAGNFPPGTYHLQIYNQGSSWVLQNIAVYHSPAPGAPDAGPSVDVDAGGPGAETELDDGGCGCRGAPAQTGALAGLLLLLGLTLWPRRRRRSRA